MVIEKRGKYPGVKVHLDGEEARRIMEDCQAVSMPSIKGKIYADPAMAQAVVTAYEHVTKLAKKIAKEFKDYPSLFDERTEEEIKEELETEFKAAGDKLAAIEKGKDWKGAGK